IFEDSFRGGLYVDTAKDATGKTVIVIGAGNTGGPRVTLIDPATGQVLANFFAGDAAFRGGVTAMVTNLVQTSTKLFIVAGAGVGAAPIVTIFDTSGTQVGSFTAGDAADRQGIRVREGDFDATTGVRSILVAPFS